MLDHSLLADEPLQDLDALLERLDAGEAVGRPGVAEEHERPVLGKRAAALVVDRLADETLEDRMDDLAEA